MKKLLLIVAMFLRKGYSLVFEFFVMLKIKKEHTKEEIEKAKAAYSEFVASVKTISDYVREVKKYKWTSDILKGLIDWSPSKKNLWTFFLDKKHSRDCDDFAALAYFTLKDLGFNVREYCVLVDNKINQAHMVVLTDDGDLFCNNNLRKIYVLKDILSIYKSKVLVKYR